MVLIANNRVNNADTPLQLMPSLLQRLSVITSRRFTAMRTAAVNLAK